MIKRKYTYLLLTGCLLSCLLGACSKDSGTSSKSKTEILTAGIWKIATVGVDLDKNGTVDLPYTLEACEKDNTYKFNANGSGVADEGATKCDPSDPQAEDFSWSFQSNETILRIAVPNSLLSGDTVIKSISDTSLELYIDVDDPGSSANVRLHIKLVR